MNEYTLVRIDGTMEKIQVNATFSVGEQIVFPNKDQPNFIIMAIRHHLWEQPFDYGVETFVILGKA